MRCPGCNYESTAQIVQCPGCQARYNSADLQELAHLEYLQDRVMLWEDEQRLPHRITSKLLAYSDDDIERLKEQLSARRAPQSTVAAPPPGPRAAAPTIAPPPAHAPVPSLAATAIPYPAVAAITTRLDPAVVAGNTRLTGSHPGPGARKLPPATRRSAAVPIAQQPPKPVRPPFSWRQVGVYLLSERTLNGLLALGAFLILAAAFVISTLNPTGLAPLGRLAAMLITTVVFYGAGYAIEQRLKLFRAGAALLGIGAAFIPFDIWTLGQDALLAWDHSTIWLMISVICLPVYLASYLLLRDRIFALLSTVTGASLLLVVAHLLGLPIEWGLCALVGLALGYVVLARRLGPGWKTLSWALFWSAQAATPAIVLGLLAIKIWPQLWNISLSGQIYLAGVPSDTFEYAVGGAWWLGVVFYALTARLTGQRVYAHITAWLLPCAYLLILTKAPFGAAWYDICLAALAAGYLAYGYQSQRASGGTAIPLRELPRRPSYAVGLALSVLAACWPLASSWSLAATLCALTGIYWLATALLRQPACRYIAVYMLPLAVGVSFQAAGCITWLNLGYAVLGAVYLLMGRFALREPRHPYSYAALVREPIFQVAGLLALLAAAWPRFAPASHDLTTCALILIAAAATILLEGRAWAYITVYIWFFTTGCAYVAQNVLSLSTSITTIHVRVTNDTQGLLWAGIAAGALLAAEWLARRTGEARRPLLETAIGLGAWRSRFAAPLFSLGYLASLIASGLCLAPYLEDRTAPTGTALAALVLVTALYGLSSATRRDSVFLYPASWLAIVPFLAIAGQIGTGRSGLLLSMPEQARLLALLGLTYLALGYGLDRFAGRYARPIYLTAYLLLTVSMIGAASSRAFEMQVLGLGLIGFAWSAWLLHRDRHPSYWWLVERLLASSDDDAREIARSLFLYLIAWLFPLWLCLLLSLRQPTPVASAYDLSLIGLSLAYLALGRRFAGIRPAYRWPWYLTAYGMNALGLALLTDQHPSTALLGYGLSALLYAASARIFRHSGFAWPLALTLAVSYGLALVVSPLSDQLRGLALLPGLLAVLAPAERLRLLDRIAEDTPVRRARTVALARWLGRWSTPFYLVLHVGAFSVLVLPPESSALYAVNLWALVTLYGIAACRFSRPRWLYLAASIGVLAYGITLDALARTIRGYDLSADEALVSLIAPVYALLLLGHLVSARDPRVAARPTGLARIRDSRWACPLLVVGLLTAAISTLGALAAGTTSAVLTSLAYTLLASALASLWQSRATAWAAIGLAAFALREVLIQAGMISVDRPVAWATAAFLATLLSIASSSFHGNTRGVWTLPLFQGSLAAGALAAAVAIGNQVALASGETLRALSYTIALAGLTLVAHGVSRGERRLSYGGVALLEAGYMLQLPHFNVGQPQAFVLPAGVYLLVVAFLEWRRGASADIKNLLEIAALVLLLGSTVLQATGLLGDGANHYTYDLFLLFEGLALVGLGVVLRWRKPFFAGSAAIVLGVIFLLADPLRAAASWYLLFGIGAALIGLVIFLEQQRQQIPLWLDDWRLRLDAWS